MKNAEAESKDAQSHAGAKAEGRMMNDEMPVKATQCYPKATTGGRQNAE